MYAQGKLSPAAATRWVMVNPICSRTEYFKFMRIKKSLKTVKVNFKLTDVYYKGLPIEQGVLCLRRHNDKGPF